MQHAHYSRRYRVSAYQQRIYGIVQSSSIFYFIMHHLPEITHVGLIPKDGDVDPVPDFEFC